MRSRRAATSSVVVLAAVLSLMTGCSKDPDDAASTSSTTVAPLDPTVVSTTAPASTTPPTTAAPVIASFSTPSAAGTALYGAWTTSDRSAAGALNLAPPAELDKLFAAAPQPSAKNRGCDDGAFGSASCFFGNGEGGVNVTLSAATGSWSITNIDPFG